MADRETGSSLDQIFPTLRSRIAKHRADKNFNEQNTKASLIVPVLQSLGWDTNDPDEVHWEYKPKPKYNPVDFALMLQRTPCLFLEAKALRDPLTDDKLTAQILTYGSVAGVEWIVLTNGDEYRVYNASAPVPIEEKLFRKICLTVDSDSDILATLSLLSRANLQDKKIGRLWTSNFIDRRVGAALNELLNPADPDRGLARAIRRITGDSVSDSEIRSSLRRARVQVDFPPEPESVPRTPARHPKGSLRARRQQPAPKPVRAAGGEGEVSIINLIAEGLLRAPAEISSEYFGHRLTAVIGTDGTIRMSGKKHAALSAAGGFARLPYFKGSTEGRPSSWYPSTNGWTFWKTKDSDTGELVELDVLRQRFLAKKKSQAERFKRASEG